MLRVTIAQAIFGMVFVLTVANALIHPAFLGPPSDLFADYIKVALSYPGSDRVRPGLFHDLVERYANSNDYARDRMILSPGGAAISQITHFHLTPLTTLFSVGSLKVMTVIDPVVLFAALAASLVGYTCWTVGSAGRDIQERALLGSLGLIAYPTLMMLSRGNLFAGLTCALILHATLLSVRGSRPTLAICLIAVAVNIRPNAVAFVLPVLAFAPALSRWGLLLRGAAMALVILLVSMAAAHVLYPDYSPRSFLAGLQVYSRLYVFGDAGIMGGSSLLLPLKLVAPARVAPVLCLIAGAIIGAGAIILCIRRADRAVILFIVGASYALGSAVFGDYHLAVFAGVPIAAIIDVRPMRLDRAAALAASALVLAPKVYADPGTLSLQTLVNPLLLLSAVTLIAVVIAKLSIPLVAER